MHTLWLAIRSLRWREWGVLALAGVLAVGAGILGYVVVDAANARQEAAIQAQAQRDQAIDARKAQTRRIDQLTEQVDGLRDVVEGQARTIGRQEQAIRDLATQVQHTGQRPVVTSVAPRPSASRTPAPKPGTKPTSTPRPSPRPTNPTPDDNPGLVCRVLIIIC